MKEKWEAPILEELDIRLTESGSGNNPEQQNWQDQKYPHTSGV